MYFEEFDDRKKKIIWINSGQPCKMSNFESSEDLSI